SELHDSIGQKISLLKMKLQSDELPPDELENVYKTIDELISEVREISRELKPQFLKESGLSTALSSLIKRLNELSDVKGEFDIHGEIPRMDYEKELALYRVVQECINNILKHSHANEYSVQAMYKDEKLSIMVVDDGEGFDFNKIMDNSDNAGFGILNMQERIENIGGEIVFNSEKGSGTIVKIDLRLIGSGR
ncbi:MAG: sensor histidine kinase, partial [Ignavibacteria bacterium]